MPRTRPVQVVVDDADVNHWVDMIRRHADFSRMSADERANAIARMLSECGPTLYPAQSKQWTRELARKVRKRLMFATPLKVDE